MSSTSDPQPANPPAKSSPIRLVVLLGLLGVVIAMLIIDQLVFKPGAEQAQERLKEATEAKMKMGVTKAEDADAAPTVSSAEHYTVADEVHKIVGRQPTFRKEEGNHVIETYAWWGYIPFNRHRFDVMYRKTSDGTLIYENHDGHLSFDDVRNIDSPPPKMVDLETRPNPESSEGTEPLDETVPRSEKEDANPAATPEKEADAPAADADPAATEK